MVAILNFFFVDSVGGMNVIANIVGMSLGNDYLQICQTKETNNPPFLCLFKYLYDEEVGGSIPPGIIFLKPFWYL